MNGVIILGTGGHAKSIADSIISDNMYKPYGFVSENKTKDAFSYNEIHCVGCDDDLQHFFDSGITCAAIGVGYLGKGTVRNRLYEMLKSIGYEIPAIIDKTAAVASTAKIGEGTFVGKNAVINSDAKIGKMCIINSGAIVEHDCVIEDYSHIACGAVLCGGVHVGTETLIGANATIIEGLNVESKIIIPAGEILTRKNMMNIIRTHIRNRGGG